MRTRFWIVAAMLAAAALAAGIAVGANGSTNKKTFEYAIGLWGDLPYSDAQAARIPSLIDDMNGQQLAFSVNDGDLKAGSGPCPDSLYQQALAWLDELQGAAMFTPGDNDWTDCDRDPAYNSLERLSYERRLFFSTDASLGTHPITQEVQAQYPENRRWTVKGVTYATLNVQGSCNNLCDVAPDPSEWAARNEADIDWLEQTFNEARSNGSAAIMLVSQADPGFDLSDATRAPARNPRTLAETDGNPDGFVELLRTLRNLTIAFGKPVAYVHGDSHYFRVDKPLLDVDGKRIENFTRVETFGDNQTPMGNTNDVQWLKVLVDPQSRDVFAYQPQTIAEDWSATPSS